MPTYGYLCTGCDNGFEVVQKISDDPLTTCEACGGELRKKIFPVGIQFKGSGFYVNDYAKKSEAATVAKTDASAPASDKAEAVKPVAEAKAETTPAASAPAESKPAATPAAA